MTTIFILADNTCTVRVITDRNEVPKIMQDFARQWHFWDDISKLNQPGGCVRLVGTSNDYQAGRTVLSITRYDI
uniref:Uncharacterized protein n=1 Tax=Pseudomonas phage Cygsa01 TaxID=3138529 RepID=A0AAU6W3G4_9VIRU